MSRPTGPSKSIPSKSWTWPPTFLEVSSVTVTSNPLRSNKRAFFQSSKEETPSLRLNPVLVKQVLSPSASCRTSIPESKRPKLLFSPQPENSPSKSKESSRRLVSISKSWSTAPPVVPTSVLRKKLSETNLMLSSELQVESSIWWARVSWKPKALLCSA